MNEQQFDETNEISLVDIYKVLKKNLVMIFISTILIAALAAFYAYVIATPQYKSNADVMVQVQVGGADEQTYDYLTAQRLLETISDLMDKDVILNNMIDDLSLNMTAAEIRNNLTVTSSRTSFFINISYTSYDNKLARDVVNGVIDSAIEIVNNDVSFSSLENTITRTSYAKEGVFDSPNKPLFVIVGILLGGMLGVGGALIKEFLKNTITTKEQLELLLDIQVLGAIPNFDVKEIK